MSENDTPGTPPPAAETKSGRPPGRVQSGRTDAPAQPGAETASARGEAQASAPAAHHRRSSRVWIGLAILALVLAAAAYGLWPFIDQRLVHQIGTAPPTQPELPPAPGLPTPDLPAQALAPAPPPDAAALEAALVENARLEQRLAEITQRLDRLAATAPPAADAPPDEAPIPAEESEGAGALASLQARIDGLEAALAETRTPPALTALETELARSQADVAALQQRLAALEQREATRRAASQAGFDLLLAAQSLRQAMHVGAAYESELDLLVSAAANEADVQTLVQPLAEWAPSGIATPGELAARFPRLADRIVSAARAPEGTDWVDRTLQKLSEVVAVRRTGGDIEGDSPEARTARAEAALGAGDLRAAVGEIETLTGQAADVAAPWLAEARARLEAEALLEALDRLLLERIEAARALEPAAANPQ